jgi:hypothetical protein
MEEERMVIRPRGVDEDLLIRARNGTKKSLHRKTADLQPFGSTVKGEMENLKQFRY